MRDRVKQKPGKLAVGFPNRYSEAILDAGGNRVESFLFDFTQDTGAVAIYNSGRLLPLGAVVTNIYSDEITVLTSAGLATVQLKVGTQNLTDALAFDTGFSGTQSQALASSATAIKVTAQAQLNIAIATAALTAGKLRFFVEYKLSNDGHA